MAEFGTILSELAEIERKERTIKDLTSNLEKAFEEMLTYYE